MNFDSSEYSVTTFESEEDEKGNEFICNAVEEKNWKWLYLFVSESIASENSAELVEEVLDKCDQGGWGEKDFTKLIVRYIPVVGAPSLKRLMAIRDNQDIFQAVDNAFDNCGAKWIKMPMKWFEEVEYLQKQDTQLVRYLCDILQPSDIKGSQIVLKKLKKWLG